jgi:hypothetical protein
MISRDVLRSYVSAQPFCPFQVRTASGRTFTIHHPEMMIIRSTVALIFSTVNESSEDFDRWDTVSLMLMESVNYLDNTVATSDR